MSSPMDFPSDHLEGLKLQSGWMIEKKIQKKIGATGANFGVSYLAKRGTEVAFLKAVDFRRAFTEVDVIRAVAELANHSQWELDVLQYCASHGMSRVVRLIGHESLDVPSCGGDPLRKVTCILLEIGEGDLRGAIGHVDRPDSWKLYAIREVALALDQLHRRGVAHLDVKPSNVIVMEQDSATPLAKLGDLGRVVRKGQMGPFDAQPWPGDPAYMPPEKWYGYKSAQWNDEREAADAFLLGSLLVFLFTGLSMSTLLHHQVPGPFQMGSYRGMFDQSLIDVLVRAQAVVLNTYVRPELPATCRDELLELTRELTHPDPSKRGDKVARRQGVVGIDRYHQKLLRIAQRVAFEERKRS